jgi:hypothetical protein
MKNNFFAVLAFALFFGQLDAANSISSTLNHDTATLSHTSSNPGDVKVVISHKRIWFVADELPLKCLKTRVIDAKGKVVIEKCFTSKSAQWSLDIEALPKGEYTLVVGERNERFKK